MPVFLLGSSSFLVIFFGLLPWFEYGRSVHKLFEPYTCLNQVSKRIQSGYQLWWSQRTAGEVMMMYWVGKL